ncbi:putative gustatory receptor 28b [Zophobas morio]|uniref:putative gustatory receptor 28b n=1 Tax=Zophobas morio TaxID=2755281 RepID=UPI003083D393
MHIRDIYDAVFPILFTTACFGLSSILTTTQNNIRKLKIFNILRILNIIYISLFTYLIYRAVSDFKTQQLHSSYASGVSKIGIIFQLLAQILLIYVIYTVNISKSVNVLSSIEDIKKIDAVFQDLGETINYNTHFMYEVVVILVGCGAILGRAVITHLYMSKSVFSTNGTPHLILSYPSFVSYIIQNNFVLLVKLLHERFNLINKLLEHLIEEKMSENLTKIKVSQEYQLKHGLKRIELLMELHDCLTDVGNKVNDTFTIQILSCFTAQFLTEVFTIFYVYYEILVLKNKVSALIWSMWTLWTTLEVFLVTITCHLTCKESKSAGLAIHKVLMIEYDPYIKRKLMIFSQQICHRPLQFTACGLFSIDTSLIFTIAGAAATYLLIMLQFQEGIEAQCSNITVRY